MSKWRQAGLTYVHFSNIAARVVRNGLKDSAKAEAAKRSDSHIKFTKWINGKPEHER